MAFSEDQIIEYERNCDCKSIILFTANLDNDTRNDKYISMVKNVISKGVNYHYIVPQNYIIMSRITDLKEIFIGRENQLKISILAEDEFRNLTTTNVVIYSRRVTGDIMVAIELSVLEGGYWWVAISRLQGDVFIGRMNQILMSKKDYSNKKHSSNDKKRR